MAYILSKNELIKDEEVMDRETLQKAQMSQRNNYIPVQAEDIPDIEKRAYFKTNGVCP